MAREHLTRWNIFFLLLWGLFLTFCLSIYLTYLQPAKLTPLLEKELEKYLQTDITIANVNIDVFPHLGFTVEYIFLDLPHNNTRAIIEAEKLECNIAWAPLLFLNLNIKDLTFHNANIILEVNQEKIENIQGQTSKSFSLDFLALDKSLHPIIQDTYFNIENSSLGIYLYKNSDYDKFVMSGINAHLMPLESIRFSVENIDSNLENFPSIIDTQIAFDTVNLTNNKLVFHYSLLANVDSNNFLFKNNIDIKGEVALSSKLELLPSKHDLDIISRLTLPNQHIDTRATFSVDYKDIEHIEISKASFTAEKDKIDFSGTIKNVLTTPTFEGKIDIINLGLARWLDFARNVPPTLSLVLNSISGSFDAIIDAKGINATNLKAQALDFNFIGNGSYSFEGGQALKLDLSTDYISIDKLFPEVLGKDTKALDFKSIALDKEFDQDSEDNNKKSEKSEKFQYDIALHAKELSFIDIKAENAHVSIVPHVDGVALPIKIDSLSKGSADANLVLADYIQLDVDIKNLVLDEFFKPLVEKDFIDGKLTGSLRSKGVGTNLLKAFQALQGKLSLCVSNGNFINEKESLPFRKLDIIADVKKNNSLQSQLIREFITSSTINLETSAFNLSLQSPNTKIIYDITQAFPLEITKDSTSIDLFIPKKSLHLQAKSSLSFNYPKQYVKLTSLNGTGDKFTFGGNLTLNSFKEIDLSGNISLLSNHFSQILKKFNILVPNLQDKSALTYLDLKMPFTYKNSTFSSTNFKAILDNTKLTGDLVVDKSKQKASKLNIFADEIYFDRYYQTEKKSQSAGQLSKNNKKIPLDIISKMNINGNISVNKLWIANTPLLNFAMPYDFFKGKIRINPTASFPSHGSMAINLNAQRHNNSLFVSTKLKANDVNVLALTKARGQKNMLAGTGAFTANTSNVISTYADFINTLNGDFSFMLSNGYMVSSKNHTPHRSLSFPPRESVVDQSTRGTEFSHLSATGKISDGIFSTNNIKMLGSLRFSGGGAVDLKKWILNLHGNAEYNNITKIPINIKGSLSDPNLSVEILKTIANTIQSVTGVVIDSFTDIVTAPFKLF